MAYGHGQTSRASDFNDHAASANSLWGTGSGDRGYGQGTLSVPAVGTPIKGSDWTSLRTVLANLCSWQNTATTLLPPSGSVAAGAAITAFPTGETPSIPDLFSLCDTNRLNYVVGNMTLTSSAASTTRGSTWDSFIQAGFSITFADENAARYFFNTGGELRIAFAHPNTSSSQDINWHDILDNL